MAERMVVLLIPLDRLRPSSVQPRKTFSERRIRELADSIRSGELISPILVRPIDGEEDRYEIVCGERRFRAYLLLAAEDPTYDAISAIVRPMTNVEAIATALTENGQREDLDPVERSEAVWALKRSGRYTWDELAARLGEPVETVKYWAGLRKMRSEIKEAVIREDITEGHAHALHRLSQHGDAILRLLEYVIAEKPSVEKTKTIAGLMKDHPTFTPEGIVARLETDPASLRNVVPVLDHRPPTPGETGRRAARSLVTFFKGHDPRDVSEREQELLETALGEVEELLGPWLEKFRRARSRKPS